MGHWKKLFPDQPYLGAWDFEDVDGGVSLTIREIKVEALHTDRGDEQKPVVYFEKTEKGLVLNKTNAKTIAGLYGTNVDEWVGRRVELYATECQAFGERKECIRIKPTVPKEKPVAASN
jgi:hypothetical protein